MSITTQIRDAILHRLEVGDRVKVGEPGRNYLWILSRTPQMDESTYRQLTELAASQGFEVSKLVRTKHGA